MTKMSNMEYPRAEHWVVLAEQEAQLPQRNSASAARMEGG